MNKTKRTGIATMSTMSTKADERSKVQGQNARTHESDIKRSTYEVKT